MSKVITEGLVLTPPGFSAGLANWSSGNGVTGDASYASQANAGIIGNDQDFGVCMELQKVSATQKLRAFFNTPLHPDMYLRLRVRVKAVSGNLPQVAIGGWPGNGNNGVSGLTHMAPARALTSYGEVVELVAIIGSGRREGVDLAWGVAPSIAHIGLDLTGPSGGVVRIEDFQVEDVTHLWLREIADVVDVRDYGARGDGTTNDLAAFQAADAAANGRTVLVSKGHYRIAGNLTLNSPVRFVGTLVQPPANRLVLTRNYDLETYSRAFGGDTEGFKKALQALFYFSDHVIFDMSGRRVDLDAPIDVAQLSGQSTFATRRVLRNGSLNAVPSTAWNSQQVTSLGTYTPSAQSSRLTGVANVANIPVGSLVLGTGVGREVYVRAKNISAGTLELSQPLYGAAGTRSYTFRRFQYMLDFSGFSALSRFEIHEVEFNCLGLASGVNMASSGSVFRFDNCTFNRPKDRGITSTGTGCQGMYVDYCQFLSNEQALAAQDRTTIAMNVQANDVKIRNNRIVRFRHFAVMNGTSHMIYNNHFFQGDDQTAGVRLAGLIFTQTNVATVMQGNYVDNCFIEWGNEHDPMPEFNNEFSFGGLNLIGNIFIASDVSAAFRWLVVKPYGPGHFLNGFSMVNNTFRVFNAVVGRVEKVDSTFSSLDFARSRDVRVEGNTFNQVSQSISNPIVALHSQNTAAETWTVDASAFIPFGGRIRMVEAVQPEGNLQTAANANRYISATAFPGQGPEANRVQLRWGEAVKGRAVVTMRMDVPV